MMLSISSRSSALGRKSTVRPVRAPSLLKIRVGMVDVYKRQELGRLEAAEHLSYCDECMDRYTALLTADVLEEPPRSARGAVLGTIWVRLMQNTWGRAAGAAVRCV